MRMFLGFALFLCNWDSVFVIVERQWLAIYKVAQRDRLNICLVIRRVRKLVGTKLWCFKAQM